MVTSAVCATIGWAITVTVTSLAHTPHASDVEDGVIGTAFLLGAPLGFVLALLMPRAQPSSWLAKPFRRYAAWERQSPRRARQREWIIRQPVEASVVLGGFWGLWMFAASPLMGGAYDFTSLLLTLVLGLGAFGPLTVWLTKRQQDNQ